MSETTLTGRVREVNRVFLRSEHEMPAPKDCVQKLADIIKASALLIDGGGELIAGYRQKEDSAVWLSNIMQQGSVGENSPLEALLKETEPQSNIRFPGAGKKEEKGSSNLIVEPIVGGGRRLGTLLVSSDLKKFDDDQIILSGIGATMLGMLLIQLELDISQEDARNKALATVAFESLSYSEVEAIQEVLKKVKNNENVIIASKIADGLGITRSVIVNALRKFESAGIIESRSLGMKGTFIRVKNMQALDEISAQSSKIRHMR